MVEFKDKIILITDPKERFYYTGFASTDGYVMMAGGNTTLVIDSRYFFAARRALKSRGIAVVLGSDFAPLNLLASSMNTTEIGVDFALTTLSQKAQLEQMGFTLFDVSDEIGREMEIKTAAQLKLISKACRIAERSLKETLPMIKEGVSEREVAAFLEYRMKMNGASDKSFDTIVAFGDNSAVPHHETCGRKLMREEPVLIDFGCVYHGYCSDMTRTFWYGDKPTEEFRRAYLAVLDAHMAARQRERAGMTGVKADSIARDSLTKAGYGKYFTHSLGHGIGVNIHERPWISPNKERSSGTLADNMVFSIEPGVYMSGKFGIRIEDSVYLSGGKVRSFMTMTKRLKRLK